MNMNEPSMAAASSAPVKPKRVRRTADQIAAERGAALARDVSNLPLGQLESFAKALQPAVADFVKVCLNKPRS